MEKLLLHRNIGNLPFSRKSVLKKFLVATLLFSLAAALLPVNTSYAVTSTCITTVEYCTTAEEIDSAVYNGRIKLSPFDTVGTGNTFSRGGITYTLLVLGDCNGDGKIGTADYLALRDYYLQKTTLTSLFVNACDINTDGNISSADFLILRDLYLKRISMSEIDRGTVKIRDGAILPKNIYAPTATENAYKDCGDGTLSNFYSEFDVSSLSDGFIDFRMIFPGADTLDFTVDKDGEANRFIIRNAKIYLPLRFGFTYGSGTYKFKVYAKSHGKRFCVADFNLDVNMADDMNPFLISAYPTCFDDQNPFVLKAAELCSGLPDDYSKVSACYLWICDTFRYLISESTNEFTYCPDLDAIYSRRYGVCWDFSAALAAMLRSQGIPCRVAGGYAYGITDVGHSWAEVYLPESYSNGFMDIYGGKWTILDITYSLCKSDKIAARNYIRSVYSQYNAFKYF